jgi:hypothetical protein
MEEILFGFSKTSTGLWKPPRRSTVAPPSSSRLYTGTAWSGYVQAYVCIYLRGFGALLPAFSLAPVHEIGDEA